MKMAKTLPSKANATERLSAKDCRIGGCAGTPPCAAKPQPAPHGPPACAWESRHMAAASESLGIVRPEAKLRKFSFARSCA